MSKGDAILAVLGLDGMESIDNVKEAYEYFQTLGGIKSILEAQEKKLRTKLFALAERDGVKGDNGSAKVEFEDGTGYQKQVRVTLKVNPDAVKEYADSHNLPSLLKKVVNIHPDDMDAAVLALENILPDAIDRVVDEGELETSVLNGVIPQSDFEAMVDRKEVTALVDLAKRKKGEKNE